MNKQPPMTIAPVRELTIKRLTPSTLPIAAAAESSSIHEKIKPKSHTQKQQNTQSQKNTQEKAKEAPATIVVNSSSVSASVQNQQKKQPVQQRSRPLNEQKPSQLIRRTSSSIDDKNKKEVIQNAKVEHKKQPLTSDKDTEKQVPEAKSPPSINQVKKPTLQIFADQLKTKVDSNENLKALDKQQKQPEKNSSSTSSNFAGVSTPVLTEVDTKMDIEKSEKPNQKKRFLSEVVEPAVPSKARLEDPQLQKKLKKNDQSDIQKEDNINDNDTESVCTQQPEQEEEEEQINQLVSQDSTSDNSPKTSQSKQTLINLLSVEAAASQELQEKLRQSEEAASLAIKNAEAETARVLAQAEAERIKREAEVALVIQKAEQARIAAQEETKKINQKAREAELAAIRAAEDFQRQTIEAKKAKIAEEQRTLNLSISDSMKFIESKREQIIRLSNLIQERLSPESLAALKLQAKKQQELVYNNTSKKQGKAQNKVNMKILDCLLKDSAHFLENLRA